MGCYLTLIAFDEEPNLASVGGLLDYRLYKREGRSEWYLDSPDKRFPNFPLVQPPSIDRRNLGDAWANAVQEYTWLVAETKRQDRDTFGLDYQLIPVALALSAALQTRLLAVSGNDEESRLRIHLRAGAPGSRTFPDRGSRGDGVRCRTRRSPCAAALPAPASRRGG